MPNEGPVLSDKIFKVSEITQVIKLTLETALPAVWVEGEISNLHRHQSGHVYFTLKDERSQLRAALFRFEARQVKFELKDGLQVLCRGRVNVYEPRGEYQLVVERVEPKGKGALQLAFEQLKEKLKAEGLFDLQRKRPLPSFPKMVGVVTSPRGAAIADILRTLERRFAPLHILLYPVKVQGEGAADEIVEAIDYFGAAREVDVLIVGRGGGSIEDLWAFNEEKVARAIARSPIPVISAVGHEVDYTIADFVADVRAATPTAAAEMVIEKEESFRQAIAELARRAAQAARLGLQTQAQTVFRLTHHRTFQAFRVTLLNLQQRIDELETRGRDVLRGELQGLAASKSRSALAEERLAGLMRRKLQALQVVWEKLAATLSGASPLNILKKGYALCWKDGGARLVRAVDEVRPGDDVTVSFFKGEFEGRVKSVDRAKPIESRVIKE